MKRRRALHERADRGAVHSRGSDRLPSAPGPLGPAASAGRSLIMISSVTKFLPRCDASPGDPQRPAGPQARDELPFERATALHVERLIDRLVRDPHRLIIGEVDPQPVRDLLRAPRRRPPTVLAPRLVATLPRRWSQAPAPPSRPAGEPDRRAAPARTRATDHRRRASRSSGDEPSTPPSTARPTPGNRASRRGWPRCGAAHERSSTAIAQAAGRSPAPRHPAPSTARSPPAPRNDRYRPDSGASMNVGIPPRSRNHRLPAACDTPTASAASSLLNPLAISPPEQPLDITPQRRLPRRLHRRPARQLRHPPSRPAHRNPPRSSVATTS